MSLFVLDTDTLTLLQDGHPTVCRRAAERPQDELAISVLSVEEQLSGWYTALRQGKQIERLAWAYRRLAENVRFLSFLQIIPFDEPAILRYQTLAKLKVKIRKTDLRIGATALEIGATVVTRNSRDFKLIPGLTITDWSV